MKTKTTMLEYCKKILQSVSFSRQLLRKEYRKSIQWLKPEEQLYLKHWIRNVMKPSVLRLRNIRSIIVFVISIEAIAVIHQYYYDGFNHPKISCHLIMATTASGCPKPPQIRLGVAGQIQTRQIHTDDRLSVIVQDSLRNI